MDEIPTEQRSGGNIWRWIIGLIVVVLVIWVIAGLFDSGVSDEPIVPPEHQQPAPEEQQQPQDSLPGQQSQERSSTSENPRAVTLESVPKMDLPAHRAFPDEDPQLRA